MPLPKASNSLYSNSFLIFMIRFFPSLANLVVVILYSKYLPQAVYGDYQHFWIHLFVIYPIICFGIHVLVITYAPDFIVGLIHRLKALHYLLYLLWAAVLSCVFAALQYRAINITFLVPFLFILSFSLSFIFESFLIVFKNYSGLITINVLYSVAFCVIHWYVLSRGFSLQLLITYLLIITVLRFCIYIAIAVKEIKQTAPGSIDGLPPGKIRSLWIHLGFYDISQVLFNYIDKFVISIFLTSAVSAVYFNGSQNIPFIPLLLSAAGSAVLMQLAAGKKQDETTDTIRLMNQSGKILSSVVFPLFFFLLFFRYEVVVTILTDKYASAVPIFLVANLVIPVRAYNFTTVLQRLHKGHIINVGAFADLVLACALMYPLYKWMGLPGVALSFVITTYLQAAFYLFYTAKLLHTSPLKLIPYVNWLIKFIVFASLFIAIHYFASRCFTHLITLILGLILLVLLTIVSILIELKMQEKDVSN